MAPLIVLLSVFVIASVCAARRSTLGQRGRLALAVMLLFTAGSHFTSTASLAAMLPLSEGIATGLVYVTGLVEIAFALALLRRRRRAYLGGLLALLFVALLPANIYSAVAGTGMSGFGPEYLWFRIPAQLVFIAWALGFSQRE